MQPSCHDAWRAKQKKTLPDLQTVSMFKFWDSKKKYENHLFPPNRCDFPLRKNTTKQKKHPNGTDFVFQPLPCGHCHPKPPSPLRQLGPPVVPLGIPLIQLQDLWPFWTYRPRWSPCRSFLVPRCPRKSADENQKHLLKVKLDVLKKRDAFLTGLSFYRCF